MKLGPVTKINKRNTARSKKLTLTPCRQIAMSLSFFQFMTSLEQSGSLILNAVFVKLTFSLTVNFYISKNENNTRKSLTQLSYYYFEQS